MSGAQPSEADLYAAGLGLLLFSPPVFADMPDGADFMADLDIEPKGRLYDQLVLAQWVVLLGTGSPEINYRVRVVLQPEAADEPLGSTEFGLRIEGGVLAIRDGYEPMHWSIRDPYEIRFPVPDGYYRVRALWVPRRDGSSDADMHIDLVFEPTSERIPGDGWPVLMYDGSLEPPSAERLVSEVTLRVRAGGDAIPSALRRALDELGRTFRVEVLYRDAEAHPGELAASATRTNVIVDGCEIAVVAYTPLVSGEPMRVEIQSVASPASNTVLAAAADTFERALAAIGTVVERSMNF